VEVADLEQDEKRIWGRVFIYVERNSQQGILVGKKGATITAIRKESEAILSGMFPLPVRLSVQVKVRPKWRRDAALLKRLIH
ncbi:MAG: KH domain-containing protein, partial [Alkalispirochaeta sp.]